MDFFVWLSFFIASLGICISPGNGALLCMTHGLAYGFRQTQITTLGLQVGLCCITIISGLGLGALSTTSSTGFLILKIIGGIYLIYLGVQQIWLAPNQQSLEKLSTSRKVPSNWKRFTQGFITDITNAKGIIFLFAMMPQFMVQDRPLLPQVLILTATMVGIDSVVMHGYTYLASRLTKILQSPQARTQLNRVFGTILTIVGILVLLSSHT